MCDNLNTRVWSCLLSVLIFSLGGGNAAAVDKPRVLRISVRPSSPVVLPSNTPISTTLTVTQLPPIALLRIVGSIPEGVSASIDIARQITFTGTARIPQTCEFVFDATSKGAFSRRITTLLEFAAADGVSAYEGSASVIGETDSHLLYEIKAQNIQGLPITKATLKTLVSGGAGGIFSEVSAALPDVAEGESATATIWYKKNSGLFPPSLIFNGKSSFEARPPTRARVNKTILDLVGDCEYSEVVVQTVK